MEICCFPQSISTYFYKFQSISIILSPYHSYLLIPFLTLLIYSLNGYRFSISAKNEVDLHREIPKEINLNSIFSIKTKRSLRNDWTIAHNRQLYQIKDPLAVTRTKTVVVQERIDGTRHITHKNQELNYEKIKIRPQEEQKPIQSRKIYIPPPDHPWRRFKINPYKYKQREKEKKISFG
ncbi:MAG: hypothetical protein AB1422_18350 [bacterium]